MKLPEQLDVKSQEMIQKWLNGNYDEDSKNQIKSWIAEDNVSALTDAFYKNLEFGTGGLRGIMGVGSNRINKYTIGTATQGLSNFLLKKYPNEDIKVAISYDSRNNSKYFAQITANVFSANNIKVHFFESLRPTPELSFAIRELGCQSGVMLTASHNPKEYNGYKAYGNDGGQLTAPDDQFVMDEVFAIATIDEVKFTANTNLIHSIGEDIDTLYLDKIVRLSLSPESIEAQKDLKIVYSPIHGTGITLVPKALDKFGFKNVHIVAEQSIPDGNFPTVVYPNPEEKEAMNLALLKAAELDADLILATDPDADRVGIGVKNSDGEFILLNGNQTACLLIYYLLNAWQENGQLNGSQYIVKTIVTSYLIDKIAASKKVDCFNTLTGFKFIGQLISKLQGKRYFIGGGEESYGLSVGELVRDKDAVISCAFIAEMTAYYKHKGSSLYETLLQMYAEYGLYKEDLISLTKQGKSGQEEIKAMMEKFRNQTPKTLGGSQVVLLKDYKLQIETDLKTGKKSPIDLPKSDVLQFFTEDGSIISARPSGTEPKIKFYCSVNAPLPSITAFKDKETTLNQKIKACMQDLIG